MVYTQTDNFVNLSIWFRLSSVDSVASLVLLRRYKCDCIIFLVKLCACACVATRQFQYSIRLPFFVQMRYMNCIYR